MRESFYFIEEERHRVGRELKKRQTSVGFLI
jgi:hypothetical protein